jgi:hypothetical protein
MSSYGEKSSTWNGNSVRNTWTITDDAFILADRSELTTGFTSSKPHDGIVKKTLCGRPFDY